jgi:hypothetical protein
MRLHVGVLSSNKKGTIRKKKKQERVGRTCTTSAENHSSWPSIPGESHFILRGEERP